MQHAIRPYHGSLRTLHSCVFGISPAGALDPHPRAQGPALGDPILCPQTFYLQYIYSTLHCKAVMQLAGSTARSASRIEASTIELV